MFGVDLKTFKIPEYVVFSKYYMQSLYNAKFTVTVAKLWVLLSVDRFQHLL